MRICAVKKDLPDKRNKKQIRQLVKKGYFVSRIVDIAVRIMS